MKSIILCLLIVATLEATSGRLIVRHRRQVEREGESPSSEVVVIKDTNGNYPPGPKYDFTPNDNDTNIFDLDINENDGSFNFGGHLPHFHDFHQMHKSFSQIFDAIQRRFDEMTRNMMSFDGSLGSSGFKPMTDLASIPDNTNNTETEIVTFNGRRFLKKTTTIKKGGPGSALFIRSTTFEPVDDAENTESGTEEVKKPLPETPVPGEPIQPQESQSGTSVSDSLPSSSSPSSPSSDQREREEMSSTSPSTSS